MGDSLSLSLSHTHTHTHTNNCLVATLYLSFSLMCNGLSPVLGSGIFLIFVILSLTLSLIPGGGRHHQERDCPQLRPQPGVDVRGGAGADPGHVCVLDRRPLPLHRTDGAPLSLSLFLPPPPLPSLTHTYSYTHAHSHTHIHSFSLSLSLARSLARPLLQMVNPRPQTPNPTPQTPSPDAGQPRADIEPRGISAVPGEVVRAPRARARAERRLLAHDPGGESVCECVCVRE